jgi:hypothetical protein
MRFVLLVCVAAVVSGCALPVDSDPPSEPTEVARDDESRPNEPAPGRGEHPEDDNSCPANWTLDCGFIHGESCRSYYMGADWAGSIGHACAPTRATPVTCKATLVECVVGG